MKRETAAIVAMILCITSCKSVIEQADLQSFVETGLTNVLVKSAAFHAGSGALARVPSERAVTCNLVIINPKSFDVAYTLDWDVDDSLFNALPLITPLPGEPTRFAFSFTLDAALAEHRTITFSLGKYVASINKTYDPESFSIPCDSPPNPPTRVATAMQAVEQKSVLAVLLPAEISDADITKLRISWRREDSATTRSATYEKSSLTAPASNPFASAYHCYFQASDCTAGYGYEYSVVLIDAAGQESSAVGTTGSANSFFVNYVGNGNTGGTAPGSVGYRFNATATVASRGDLALTNYAFSAWNTRADGTGTSYAPGAPLIIPAGDVTLYAQWVGNSTGITIGTPTSNQALTFADNAPSIVRGQAISFETNNATLGAVNTGWTWYIDGVAQGETSRRLSLSPATTNALLGDYLIAAQVSYGGVSYSGSLILRVHR